MSGLVRHSLKRIVPTTTSNIFSKASYVISGPPKNPVSLADKVFLGGGMCAAILFPMLWIITNIKHYKNPGGSAEPRT